MIMKDLSSRVQFGKNRPIFAACSSSRAAHRFYAGKFSTENPGHCKARRLFVRRSTKSTRRIQLLGTTHSKFVTEILSGEGFAQKFPGSVYINIKICDIQRENNIQFVGYSVKDIFSRWISKL